MCEGQKISKVFPGKCFLVDVCKKKHTVYEKSSENLMLLIPNCNHFLKLSHFKTTGFISRKKKFEKLSTFVFECCAIEMFR